MGKWIDLEKDFVEEKEMELIEEVVVNQYKGGMGVKEIIKRNGIPAGTVYSILKRHNVPLRSPHYDSKSRDRLLTMTKEEKDNLIQDYLNGMSTAEIYKKYDINKHGCYTILDLAGIPRRKRFELEPSTQEVTETEITTQPSSVKRQNPKKEEPKAKKEQKTYSVHIHQDGKTVHITIPKTMGVDQVHISFA